MRMGRPNPGLRTSIPSAVQAHGEFFRRARNFRGPTAVYRAVTQFKGQGGRAMFRRVAGIVALGTLEAVVVIGAVTRLRGGLDVSITSVSQITHAWLAIVTDWRYGVCLGLLMLAELVFPAQRDMRGRAVGFAQDATWFVVSSLLALTVVSMFLGVLDAGLSQMFRWWRPDLTGVLGTAGVALLAFVVGDLCGWWSHWLHHRTPLWEFHAVHHSQTAMNVLSDNRQHIIETIVNATLVFVPARMLGLDAGDAGLLAFASIAFAAFIHANIRTNLGVLRYFLVSPQAHRVHHSVERDHYDTNFGVVLGCWDYLFRTQYHDPNAYPGTGIEDAAFPMESSCNPIALVRTWWAQTKYPFAALAGHKKASVLTTSLQYYTHPTTKAA